MAVERERIRQADLRTKHWRRWGPYLSERQWGTVREDYSPYGTAWDYFPFEHAHLRAYRWGEDGICGISDNHQRVCFSIALWNGQDPILKERLFGVTNEQGNHGEDVKELYYYLDSTPTHSYMKALYKYPQREYPYQWLKEESARRGCLDPEPELIDCGIFDADRYFDVFIEYAKADVNDILIRLTVHNRADAVADLDLLPMIWFRNRWSWGRPNRPKPRLEAAGAEWIQLAESKYPNLRFWLENPDELLFTDNESNALKLWGLRGGNPYTKDAFNDYIVHGRRMAVNPEQFGTKAAGRYRMRLERGETRVVRLRLTDQAALESGFDQFDAIFSARKAEADEFYAFEQRHLSEDACRVQRQALAGLLWSKQFYHYVVEDWLDGDPAGPPPPRGREMGRNRGWIHLFNEDVISMPDKWEYPWYAAWDLAFHMIPMAIVDPGFAKQQLALFLREWYMHPNGQIPAYEWTFDDVNPPVHAWACWRVYKIDARINGKADIEFLKSVYHKLLMNFTWWVNRKDSLGDNIFEGGFLGLDNIGVFDRNKPLPDGGTIEQSDGTSWMAMFSLNMLRIALELARHDPVYEDIASKFFEHFLYIASAMNKLGGRGLWDEDDGFFYDRMRLRDGRLMPLRVRSMVGLIPLFAVETIDFETLNALPGFHRRMRWFQENRPDLSHNIASTTEGGVGERRLLALVNRERLERVLRTMLSEAEFLSPYGLRSMSRYHLRAPYVLTLDGSEHRVDYVPGESVNRMFGGNSNWRGPIWFPVNYLMIESLQRFGLYYGDSFQVEFPTGSGRRCTLTQVAAELSKRLSHIFLRDTNGNRPCFGSYEKLQTDPEFRDHLLFHEYFHGENGAGLGANHQTGWTALVAKLLQQSGE